MNDSGRHRLPRQRRYSIPLTTAVVGLLVIAVYFGVKSLASDHVSAAQTVPTTHPVDGRSNPSPSTDSAVSTPTVPIPGITPLASPSASAEAIGDPVHLSVPSIGIETGLQPLHLLTDGTLQSPSSWNVAGWYSDGIKPGQIGPAVIAGHIDSTKGPAVFYRLNKLVVGAQAIVTEQDGAVLTFVVDDLQSYPKSGFPATAVYGPTPYPQLRLITCTGDFDYATHNYLDNLVVSAHLVSGGAT
jgi:sortase (surface protein transpeptidase)